MQSFTSHNFNNVPIFKLRIFVEDPDLKNIYVNHILRHNQQIDNQLSNDSNSIESNGYFNAGFDIICPENYSIEINDHKKFSMQIKCAGFMNEQPWGYTMWPRSSISKTPLRLANSAGIIDSGYRGDLIAAFDCINSKAYIDDENYKKGYFKLKKGNRYLQICSPSMGPIKVELVDTVEDLGLTQRGDGGFGSTGQ